MFKMAETHYNKLVRDKIPEIIRANGGTPIVHTATPTEFRSALIEKLAEECHEFQENPCPAELADVLEVVYGLYDWLGFDETEVEAYRKAKQEKRGAYVQGVILEKVIASCGV
jgi:predicted house-cleaning noncanonical NTP pyrophosphatase (MazG superfamily)